MAATWSGDIAVIGGGPAGGFCATLLARVGCRTLLVDSAVHKNRPTEVIAPTTVRLLRLHGFDVACRTLRTATCRGTYGWWGREPEFFDYSLQACGPGESIDRDEFDVALIDQARAAGAQIWRPAQVRRAQKTRKGWNLEVTRSDGTTAVGQTRFVIEAGGRARRTAVTQSADRTYSDQLFAVVCPVTVRPSDCHILLLEAAADGWWYSTSDATGRGAVVYLSDLDLIPRSQVAREQFFRRQFAVSRIMRLKLGSLPESIRLQMVDARTSFRRTPVAPGSFAVGDAAYAVDPLSGMGIGRSLQMAVQGVAAALDVLLENPRALGEYDQWVRSQFVRWSDNKNAVYAEADSTRFESPFWRRRVNNGSSTSTATIASFRNG